MDAMKLSAPLFMFALSANMTCFSQGTVNFSNVGPGLNAPVFASDGVTRLSGPQYQAMLVVSTTLTSFTPVATTSFLTGSAAGYFTGGSQIIPVPGGHSFYYAVLVWNTAFGNTYLQAERSGLPNANGWGYSGVFVGTAGNPYTSPPGLPGNLTALQSFPISPLGDSYFPYPININVPEPAPNMLMLVGLIASWRFWRQR